MLTHRPVTTLLNHSLESCNVLRMTACFTCYKRGFLAVDSPTPSSPAENISLNFYCFDAPRSLILPFEET